MSSIISFEKKVETEFDSYREKVLVEVFNNNQEEFDEAFAEASTEQFFDLLEAVFETAGEAACRASHNNLGNDIREELLDAMIGVMKQWLGEHKADNEDIVREAYGL